MPAAQSRRVRPALALLAAGLVLLVWWASTSSTGGAAERPGGGSSVAAASALPSVRAADLPTEAQHTLALISTGGPYPYSRDGVAFQNRERLLPRKAGGYYREYTVPTPGEGDRGARRIITGRFGERYYTDDHYASFRVIEGGAR